jgi:uncharacterized membrane protein required for colicin V production
MILSAVLVVIFLGILATLYTEGMWGNAIQLINTVTAALLATNFYEPASRWIEGMSSSFKSYTYCWDYLMLWGLFALFLLIFRTLTDKICHVKVRFLKIADQIGSVIFACLVGWVFVGFTLFSLHTAPLAKNFLFEGFQSDGRMMLGLAPDRAWIQFARSVSKGAYARDPAQVFDPFGKFQSKYELRREEIEKHVIKDKTLLIK